MKYYPADINPNAMVTILRSPEGNTVALQEVSLKAVLKIADSWDEVHVKQSDLIEGWILLGTIATTLSRLPYRFGVSHPEQVKRVLDRREHAQEICQAVRKLMDKSDNLTANQIELELMRIRRI